MTRSDRERCGPSVRLSQPPSGRASRGDRSASPSPWRDAGGLLDERPRATLHSRLQLLELETRERLSITLVRPEDANPGEGAVSLFSPLGQALAGRRKGQYAEAEFLGYRLPLVIMDVMPPDGEAAP